MDNQLQFETMAPDTLEDFGKLPAAAQKAYFADAKPLWPKNKDGVRVKPRKKKRKKPKVTKRTAARRKKAATKSKRATSKAKKTKKRSTRKRTRNTGLTNAQKLAIGIGAAGILTYVLVKRP